jgi:glycosyltransferase involved in cell wall biosynthesis
MTDLPILSGPEGPRAPDVSVVIPTHNRWPVVTRALRSALSQRAVTVEVVVVDDGSSDETPVRLAEYADPRVRVVRLPSPQGGAEARNAGLAECRGGWIAFLDDDDVWSPDKLRLQIDAATEAGAGFVYARAAHLREPGTVVRMHSLPDPARLASELLRINVIPAGASNVVVNASLLQALGGFDEGLDHLTDWDLWIRMSQVATAAACDEVLVGYVEHAQNRYRLAGDVASEEFEYLVHKHMKESADAGVSFDGAHFARGVAIGYLHAGRRARAARIYLSSAVKYRNPGNALRAPAALFGERFRARFAEDTRAAVRDLPWLEDVWRPHWPLDPAPDAVVAS